MTEDKIIIINPGDMPYLRITNFKITEKHVDGGIEVTTTCQYKITKYVKAYFEKSAFPFSHDKDGDSDE